MGPRGRKGDRDAGAHAEGGGGDGAAAVRDRGRGDPIACVKLFSCVSGWTWYVTEYDPTTGEASRFVEGFSDEWGYFDVRDLEALNRAKGYNVVERDEHFEPAPVSRVRR